MQANNMSAYWKVAVITSPWSFMAPVEQLLLKNLGIETGHHPNLPWAEFSSLKCVPIVILWQ